MVGTIRFELTTPSTPRKCATKLRYVPMTNVIIHYLVMGDDFLNLVVFNEIDAIVEFFLFFVRYLKGINES